MHAAKVDDLVIDDLNHVEGLVVCDGIDEDEAVDANCMLRIKDGIFILRQEQKRRGSASGSGLRGRERRTWPAVSMMSHS